MDEENDYDLWGERSSLSDLEKTNILYILFFPEAYFLCYTLMILLCYIYNIYIWEFCVSRDGL